MEGWGHASLAGFAVFAAGVVVSACNGGQSDETSASVQGNWSGSYTANGGASSIPVFALIQQSGSAYLFDSTGVVYALPSFSGSVKDSGPVTAYPAKGYTFADGSTSMRLNMQAATSSGQMDMGLDADGDSDQAASGQAHLLQLETWYGKPSVTAGQWMGDYLSPTPTGLVLTVAADGSFSGSDAYGCQLQGALTQLAAEASLFTLTIRSTGPSPACGGSMTGLAHESAYDSFNLFGSASGTYYYLCASDSRDAFVAELKVQ